MSTHKFVVPVLDLPIPNKNHIESLPTPKDDPTPRVTANSLEEQILLTRPNTERDPINSFVKLEHHQLQAFPFDLH